MLEIFHCALDLLLLSFSCQTGGFRYDSKILWDTEEFMFNSMTARCPVAIKQAKSWFGLTVGLRCLCQYCGASHYDQTLSLTACS